MIKLYLLKKKTFPSFENTLICLLCNITTIAHAQHNKHMQ